MLTRYLSHFPKDYNPSPNQIKLIKQAETAFNNGKKFVICCAPTGTGKSFLSKTISGIGNQASNPFVNQIYTGAAFARDKFGNYVNESKILSEPPHGTFVLTITKSLQDQYSKLFPETDILKGKSNYICNLDTNFDVETAPCVFVRDLKSKCCAQSLCSYYNAVNKALVSRFAALNYKMFLSLPDHVKRKNFIICDEASELEDELVKHFSAEVNYMRLKKYGIDFKPLVSNNNERARNWVNALRMEISEKVEALQLKFNKKNTLSQPDRIRHLQLKNLFGSLSRIDQLWTSCDYVIEIDSQKASFTPLRVDGISRYIFDHADNILLMSATIIDHKHFARTLGIKDYEYVEVESDFDPKKSPIYVTSNNKLNYKNLTNILPKVADQIKTIVSHHANEKGIIHTHSQEITNILKAKLCSNKRFLFRDDMAKNDDILKRHYETDFPTILVSPSLAFGIDLKDELARFQIIVKLPFSPLSNKRIKQLFDFDKTWYENKMLNSLVQACGRATRSKHDFSSTYILDGNIVNTLKRVKDKLPKYFIDRLQ